MPSAEQKKGAIPPEPQSIDEIIARMLRGEITQEQAIELINKFRHRSHSLIERLPTATSSGSNWSN